VTGTHCILLLCLCGSHFSSRLHATPTGNDYFFLKKIRKSFPPKQRAMKRTSGAEADDPGMPTSTFIFTLTSVTSSRSASAALATPCHT
jgi:hypothetical protein